MSDETARNLARNVRHLRETRGFTQQRLAELSGVPRATWAHLESGSANPTLAVLVKASAALQVSIEELIGPPRATARLVRVDELRTKRRGGVRVRHLLPEPVSHLEVDRMELPPGKRMVGVPHTPGTREVLACETGRIVLRVAGTRWDLDTGDVVVFRGDQKHSYANEGDTTAVAFSVVAINPAPIEEGRGTTASSTRGSR